MKNMSQQNMSSISEEWIEVEADCPTDAVYRETRRWYDSLKNEIELMHLNWGEIATKEFTHPPTCSIQILRNGIEDSNELSNLKFNISQNKAFEILEGASIYKDKFSCIEKLCKTQKMRLKYNCGEISKMVCTIVKEEL